MAKITEKEVAEALNALAHILVTQPTDMADGTTVEALRRVPLSAFLDTSLAQAGKAADAKAVGDAIGAIPVTVAEDGYTDIEGLRQATNIAFVQDGQTITATVTLEGGETSTSVVTLGDNGYPSKIVTDGVECAVSWEGF